MILFLPKIYTKSKKDSEDQQSIQSSATPVPGYQMGKKQNITINITNKSQEVSPFPSGDHKIAMKRRDNMTNTRHKKHKGSTKEVPP